MSEAIPEFDPPMNEPTPEELAEMVALGVTADEIARMTGLHVRTVYRRIRRPEVERAARELRDTSMKLVMALIEFRTRDALDVVNRLMRSEDERIALAAARTHLDQVARAKEWEALEDVRKLREEWEAARAAQAQQLNGHMRGPPLQLPGPPVPPPEGPN